jgi:hypothetical protein
MTTRLEVERDHVNFVRIGYQDACTDFTVHFYLYSGNGSEQLKDAIRAAGQYNDFSPARVIKAFDKIAHMVDEASFGREGSPVLYLKLKSSVAPVDAERLQRLQGEIIAAFKSAAADEADAVSARTVRLWWD